MEKNGITRKVTKVLLTNQDEIRYPFVESDNEYLKFPRYQLYRQNSKLAVLVADPSRNITISVTKSQRGLQDNVYKNSKSKKSPKPDNASTALKSDSGVKRRKSKGSSLSSNTSIDNEKIGTLETSFVAFKANTESKKDQSESENETLSIQTIGQKLLEVSNGPDFLMCDVETLCSILCSDKLDVDNESVVFRAALRWLRYQFEDRLVHAQRIMNCVRFGLIKPKGLIKCYIRSRNIGLLDSSEFCENFMIGLLWSTAAYYGLENLVKEIEPQARIKSGSQESANNAQDHRPTNNSPSRQSSFSSSISYF